MNKNRTRIAIAAAVLALAAGPVALPAQAQVSLQFRFGTRDRPLEGRQFEKMRALAHYLDESAQHAAREAVENARRGGRTERKLLSSITDFARRTDSFHDRMDNYIASPWDIPNELVNLDERARRVNDRIHRARVFEHTYDDWVATIDVLDRMKRLLAGYDVQVPPAHGQGYAFDNRRDDPDNIERNWSDNRGRNDEPSYRREQPAEHQHGGDFGYGSASGHSYMESGRLQEFRRLTQELDGHATRARQIAEQYGEDDTRMAQEFLSELKHFNNETRELSDRAAANQVDPALLRPTIQHLLDDARRADERLRRSRGMSAAWDEWAATIRNLQRMDQLTQ